MPNSQVVVVGGIAGTYSWTDGFKARSPRDEFLASVRSLGWRFVEILMEKALAAEAAGNMPSAESFLRDALRAESILLSEKHPKRQQPDKAVA